MIGPYSALAWGGYTICNMAYPFMRGAGEKSFWPTLLLAPIWGFCFMMAYRNGLSEKAMGLGHFVLFNALLALPAILASYWLGRIA